MSMTAIEIPKSYVPACVQTIDGKDWMVFYNDGTYESYKAMPAGLTFNGKVFAKRGWNSDTHCVHYCEGKVAVGM